MCCINCFFILYIDFDYLTVYLYVLLSATVVDTIHANKAHLNLNLN